jgi:L-iditol 2-dehydrogenase
MARVRRQAAVLHGVNDLRVEDSDLPEEPGPGMVRVQIKAVGICGSDVHYWCRGRIAHFVVESPMVIGHESSGIVTAVGPGVDVSKLGLGDAVALEPGIPCWSNRQAREGRYNLDPDIKFFATPPVHGSLATYIDHPADWCFKLPSNVSLEEGAMCEPLSVGIHACRRGGVQPGKKVALLGAGPIGLVTLLAAKAFGADAVAITDIKASNLQLAKELGANGVVQVEGENDSPEEVAKRIKGSIDAVDGVDIVIDCAGFESTMRTAIKTAVSGGKVVLVGMGDETMTLPLTEASIREVDIIGSFRYAHTYPTCLALLSSGKINVKPLITHRFGFDQQSVLEGFTVARDSEATGAIKVMFDLQ